MAKEIKIISYNVFKNKDKDKFKEEFNRKLVEVIKQLERNQQSSNKA